MCNNFVTCSEMGFRSGTSDCRKFSTNQPRKINVLAYPKAWDENLMAGLYWFMGFRDRNQSLSLRRLANCSLSRAISFNHFHVSIYSGI